MPYHDPFQHQHLFDLGYPPTSDAGSRRPYHSPLSLVRPTYSHTSSPPPPPPPRQHAPVSSTAINDDVATKWFDNSSAKRINTDIYFYQTLKYANPEVEVIDSDAYNANIPGYVLSTGDGTVENLSKGSKLSALLDENHRLSQERVDQVLGKAGIPSKTTVRSTASGLPDSLNLVSYVPPARRLDGGTGFLVSDPYFDRFLVQWHGHEFEIYIVDTRDGTQPWAQKRQYIVTAEPGPALALLKEAGNWQNMLHEEIWVFDQGFWQKDAALYAAIQKSRWEDIILPEALKGDLLKTVMRFYDSRETYTKLRVPWKRGLIFYGPPGNGKTVSIKATMKTLLDRKESVPTLYVKSLASWAGPEFSISQIFAQARQQAPCYLVFEDLDSLVSDEVRSFFLNAVDGLSENQGILMVGSTNHLDRLDPGIAKRPSRFDRKYLFPDPAMAERKRYCQYWQKKLKDNAEVKFPDKLLEPIARLMDRFSFAYMQEAFVSTLLKIANDEQEDYVAEEHWDLVDELADLGVGEEDNGGDGQDELDEYLLWREIKVQISNLRKELERGQD